jgi:hypothetical protein
VPDAELQYEIGWSIIGFTILNILVNLIIMLYNTAGLLKKAFISIRNKYKLWRNNRNALDHQKKYPDSETKHNEINNSKSKYN